MYKSFPVSILVGMLFVSLLVSGQPTYDCKDKVYGDNVHTVLLYPEQEPLLDPILFLGDSRRLHLSFDVLGDQAAYLYYTFVHCNHDWTPSDLTKAEYINGFDEAEIRDYRFSVNTLTPYVHYDLMFPEDQLRPKISGNYLLLVYENQFTDGQLLFSRRFFVVDTKVSIQVNFPQYPKNLDYVGKKHQLDVTVSQSNLFTTNPSESIKLVIRQNGRWDNAVTGLKPNYVYGDKIAFEYAEETVFDGGNQFRNFDMKSFRYQSERIQKIFQESDHYLVRLWPDERRHTKSYISEQDIRGRKLIAAREDQETAVEGDYAWVEFLLPYPAPLTHEDVYIIGAINDYNLDSKSLMTYNFSLKAYEAALFLKQGYYNYVYGILEKETSKADITLIEGDHWDTLNEYSLYLYFRKPGTVYDQLIATTTLLSH